MTIAFDASATAVSDLTFEVHFSCPGNTFTGTVFRRFGAAIKGGKFVYSVNKASTVGQVAGTISGTKATGTITYAIPAKGGGSCKSGPVHWSATSS
jgi:hypothetical protein